MDQNFSLLIYFLIVAVRATSFRRRWDMPLLYGSRYFYRVHVSKGFYDGVGRTLLRRYRAMLVWPLLAELVVFLVLIVRKNYDGLTSLCLAALIAMVLNQRLALAILSRVAKKFEEPEIDPSPAAVSFSLSPRRLGDYTNPIFEIILASVITLTLIFLAQMRAPMGPPLVLLYLQIGFLLIKKAIVDWRAVAPLENSEVYLEVRERRRKLLLFACDFYRGAAGFVMIKQAVVHVTTDERWRWALQYLYLAGSIACVCFAVVKTNELYRMYRMMKPARDKRRLTPPDPNGFVAGGLLYFDPDNPAMFVQGPRSVTFNAANRRLLLAATYLVGLMLLAMWSAKTYKTASQEMMRPTSTPATLLVPQTSSADHGARNPN